MFYTIIIIDLCIVIAHGVLVGILLLVGILESVGMRLALGIPVPVCSAPPVCPAFPVGVAAVAVSLLECLGEASAPVPLACVRPVGVLLPETGVELLALADTGVVLLAWLALVFLETGVKLLAWVGPAVALGGVKPLGGVLRVRDAALIFARSADGLGSLEILVLLLAGALGMEVLGVAW